MVRGKARKATQSIREVRHPLQKDTSHSKIHAMVNQNALLLIEPFSIVADQFVEVHAENLSSLFKSLRRSLIQDANRGRPTGSRDADRIISEEKFILVCRYLTASRVSRVFNIFCGSNEDSTLIPRGFPVPDILSDKINSIGVVEVQRGAYRVCPKPEPNPVKPDPEEFEPALVQFASLVKQAKARGGLITIGSFANSIEGSSWWFLTARSAVDPNIVISNDIDDVIVSASHREWTYIDALYCAAIRNQCSGLVPVEKTLKWTMGKIRTCNYLVDMTGPKPAVGEQYVEVLTENMAPYFVKVRLSLILGHEEGGTISEGDFIQVCRYLTACRAKRIHMALCTAGGDIRSPNLPPVPDLELPLGLCEIVNGIGVVMVHDGQFKICPKPENVAPDICSEPSSSVMRQFIDLVQSAKRRKVISTGRLSSSLDGTSWWLLTARRPDNPDTIASQSEEVTVYGCHKEWTARDGFLCALVQNRYDGILPMENTLKWSIGTFSGVSALRSLHNLPVEIRRAQNIL